MYEYVGSLFISSALFFIASIVLRFIEKNSDRAHRDSKEIIKHLKNTMNSREEVDYTQLSRDMMQRLDEVYQREIEYKEAHIQELESKVDRLNDEVMKYQELCSMPIRSMIKNEAITQSLRVDSRPHNKSDRLSVVK